MAAATLNDIRKFFGYENAAKFAADWRKMTEADKVHIRNGIGDETFNY